MAYYIDLFSPETYEIFTKSNQETSGFRPRQEGAASRIKVGDKLICYMVKLSRWFGVLEVTSTYFKDSSPLFYSTNDPYVIRFRVKPIVWLPKEKSIPIHDDRVWNKLSFTKNADKKGSVWTGKIRNSLNILDDADGKFLEDLITSQIDGKEIFEIDKRDYAKHLKHKVRRPEGEITVSIPQNPENDEEIAPKSEVRESIKIQALLAKIGSQMGLKIWLPRNDRSGVLSEWKADKTDVLENLPLNYDETTIKTIEQIDVLWLRGRAIVRAFEVEHTTSIYSGILRMADLLALQPNMNIKLHIVAPYARRDKVFQEIQRPVFSLLDEAPLSERCTFLSYDSVQEISELKHVEYLSDSVLDEYAEEAE
jgi:predicted RNA-binding protein